MTFLFSATQNPFNNILKTLEKPGGGGEFGKYFSLPALNDSRIGESFSLIITCVSVVSGVCVWMFGVKMM